MNIKQLQTILENCIIQFTHIVFFWMPDDISKGNALIMLHHCLNLYIIPFFILPAAHPLRLIILISVIIIAASQWIFRGCIITRAERRLTKNNVSILDSLVSKMGVVVTNDTLFVCTISSGTTLVIIMILSYVGDFFRQKPIHTI